jgi:hypothetical protein
MHDIYFVVGTVVSIRYLNKDSVMPQFSLPFLI